jgi:prephenate dehydrogenase
LIAADLVVLATPAAGAEEWLALLGEIGYAGVVTDVASTKAEVMAQAARLLGPDATFIGGHPMAGSERSGVAAADPEIFRGAYYVLTPAQDTDADAYGRLHRLVTQIGARVISLDAVAHDEAVAAISHVPHVAASALTNLAAARACGGSDVLRLAAGGFKDMTRIAAGSPDLWTGICLDNGDAVVRGLDELGSQLAEFAALLRAGDREGVRGWLARAADVRRGLPARWVPASERLREMTVSMTDRPGAVSTITQAAAHAGCNIEDIGIDHVTEDTAVLHLLLTDEGDADALVAELARDGFDVTLEPLSPEGGGA